MVRHGTQRTYWWVGHDHTPEQPRCEVSPGIWERSKVAKLDVNERNHPHNDALDTKRENVDRHSCGIMDCNGDGVPDVICSVGANMGQGEGYTEVHLTRGNGTLEKVFHHGLYDAPSMRGRDVIPLKRYDGSSLVLVTTDGRVREDGRPNWSRLYKNLPNSTNDTLFEEVEGPWNKYFQPSKVIVADFDGDGTDDILFCVAPGPARIYTQAYNGSWGETILNEPNGKNYRMCHIGDITGDGIFDLAVVFGKRGKTSTVAVFEGKSDRKPPFFNLGSAYYKWDMPHDTPDIAIFDANGDGRNDLYVVQADETMPGRYCYGKFNRSRWTSVPQKDQIDFTPPKDLAKDLLLIQHLDWWEEVWMDHAEPGCGWLVEPFGEQTLALAQGTTSRYGYGLLLDWGRAKKNVEAKGNTTLMTTTTTTTIKTMTTILPPIERDKVPDTTKEKNMSTLRSSGKSMFRHRLFSSLMTASITAGFSAYMALLLSRGEHILRLTFELASKIQTEKHEEKEFFGATTSAVV